MLLERKSYPTRHSAIAFMAEWRAWHLFLFETVFLEGRFPGCDLEPELDRPLPAFGRKVVDRNVVPPKERHLDGVGLHARTCPVVHIEIPSLGGPLVVVVRHHALRIGHPEIDVRPRGFPGQCPSTR